MATLLDGLLTELGYRQSSFYRESIAGADPSVAHLLRDAQRAHVRGSYFIRTVGSLSHQLVRRHHLDREIAHALIGRFVYLHYLREREILSDQWLDEVEVDPNAVFTANARLNAFRRVTDKVDERFNGRIFPI